MADPKGASETSVGSAENPRSGTISPEGSSQNAPCKVLRRPSSHSNLHVFQGSSKLKPWETKRIIENVESAGRDLITQVAQHDEIRKVNRTRRIKIDRYEQDVAALKKDYERLAAREGSEAMHLEPIASLWKMVIGYLDFDKRQASINQIRSDLIARESEDWKRKFIQAPNIDAIGNLAIKELRSVELLAIYERALAVGQNKLTDRLNTLRRVRRLIIILKDLVLKHIDQRHKITDDDIEKFQLVTREELTEWLSSDGEEEEEEQREESQDV